MWNYTDHTWTCRQEDCGHDGNHALANFCVRCSEPYQDKFVNFVPILSDRDSNEPRSFLLNGIGSIDVLLNVFGLAVLVDKSQGELHVYNPLIGRDGGHMYSLKPVGGGTTGPQALQQVVFDQWWIYALTQEGRLYILPVSCLAEEHAAARTEWFQVQTQAARIALLAVEGDRVFLVEKTNQDPDRLFVYLAGYSSVIQYWGGKDALRTGTESGGIDPSEPILTPLLDGWIAPHPIQQLIPLAGKDHMDMYNNRREENTRIGLWYGDEIALLSIEHPDQHQLYTLNEKPGTGPDNQDFSVKGIHQMQACRIAYIGTQGDLIVLTWWDNGDFLQEKRLPGFAPLAVSHLGIQTESDWESDARLGLLNHSHAVVLDTTSQESQSQWPTAGTVSLQFTEYSSFFGNMLAVYEQPEGNRPLQFSLIQFYEAGDPARRRSWNIEGHKIPIAPPAGYGKYVYAVVEDPKRLRNSQRTLLHYDLLDS
ncbi:MAG: hypothetical protein GKR89_32980 [Candidatus Latescibacteria bacterium]|nr:hypothetical protein [Candidatus Latescibacterota bacterium]